MVPNKITQSWVIITPVPRALMYFSWSEDLILIGILTGQTRQVSYEHMQTA